MSKGSKMKKFFFGGLRNALVSGAVVIFPIWVTVLLLRAMGRIIRDAFSLLPPGYHPRSLIPFEGIEIVTAFLVILVVGIAANNFLGKKVMSLGETLVDKIPVVKTVYQGVKHLTTGIISDRKIFSRAVLISYPIPGLSFIGFVTGEQERKDDRGNPVRLLKMFIPTTPNPTSGFFCFAPEDAVKPLDMPVEAAFRLIITAGYDGGAKTDAQEAAAPPSAAAGGMG